VNLDLGSATTGAGTLAVMYFVVRTLWAAREKRIAKNEDDLEALRAKEAAELKAKVNANEERMNAALLAHRADIEQIKAAVASNYKEFDVRLAFREGRYGAEPITMTHKLSPEMQAELRRIQAKTEGEPL
jgi:hypothetical protein